MVYLFFDGDNVGNTIERHLTKGEISKAQQISLGIKQALDEIEKLINQLGCLKILLGGDDILVGVKNKSDETELIDFVNRVFLDKTGLTISCGAGKTIQESIYNLHLAKLFGKNQTMR